MKLRNLAFLFVAIVVASSCKKDNTPADLNPDAFKNSIRAIIHYDGTDTFPSSANFYHYDVQGRLQSYSVIDGDINTNSLNSYDSVVFIYNGIDTLPVQADVYDVLSGPGGDVTHKYFYYDNERLIKDSVNGDLNSSLTQYTSQIYTYSPGLITITANGTGGVTALTQLYLTADNKNIARVVNNDPTSPTGSGTIIYTYNSSLANPYCLNNVARNLYYFGAGLLIFSSPQNAAAQLSVVAPSGNGVANITYSNIANSLPGRAVISAEGDILYTENYYYQQ